MMKRMPFTSINRKNSNYFGEKKMKRGLISFLFGKLAKKKIFVKEPWRHNLPTAKAFKILEQKDFEKERDKIKNKKKLFKIGCFVKCKIKIL